MAPKNPPKIGKYDIVDLIGRGGMGVVYKAIDPAIGRLVAIKIMTAGFGSDPELLKRFYREAQSAGKLQHPNIVTVYELGEVDGNPYLVMEFIEGESLDRTIHSRRELPLEEKLNLVVQICNGLQYAHERSIVHRDIKPGNIMVTSNGKVKIVDFGLAHVGADGMTRPGQVMGSINYMSPEQINGQPVDLGTDIFATGVVLYQLLTYALPFQGADTGSTLLKIIHEPPTPLHTFLKVYPQELEGVIERALAKDRVARYASADDFAFDLGQILEQFKREKIEQHLKVVQELVAASELEKAQEILSQVLKLDRQHRGGNELMREVRRRIQKRLAQQQAQELGRKAQEALQRQELEEALADLQEAVKLDDSSPDLVKLRDSVQEAKVRRDRIRQALQRAESSQASGELEESLKALEEVLTIDPNHADARAMHAAVSNAIRERERRKQFQELTERARKQISAREFQQSLDTLKQAELLDAAAPVLKELSRAAAAGLEQERCRREIERLAGEIEEALNRDDYRTALSRAEEGLRQFGADRRLQQLKTLAEKQRQAGERRAYIAEQIATARKLLESGETAKALQIAEGACRKYPMEPALQSMRAMVKETLAREELERQEAECTQKAKELLRRKQYSEAILLLESTRERLKTTDLDDLLQFARDEAAMHARRQKLAAITEQANRLISAEECGPAIELLTIALAESPEQELQALLADAQHRLAEFTRGVAEAVTTAQRLIAQKRIHEAVRLLESQPPSFTRSAEFATTLEQARREVRRLQAVSGAKQQAREALVDEDFDKAMAIARACRAEVGDMLDLTLLDNEINVQRTEVLTRQVGRAVADARTLLIGRSYRSALEVLDSVAACVESVSAELQAQYNSLRTHAEARTARQDSQADLRKPAVPPGKDYGPGSGVTIPQTHWTLAGAATPVMPPDVTPPPPGLIESREINIIGQGDSSSLHDSGLGLLPLGPSEVSEPTTSPPEETHVPSQMPVEAQDLASTKLDSTAAPAVPEFIPIPETRIIEPGRAPVEAHGAASRDLVSPPLSAPEIEETKLDHETQMPAEPALIEPPQSLPVSAPPRGRAPAAQTISPGAPKRGLPGGRPMIALVAAAVVIAAALVVGWKVRQKAPTNTVVIPIVTSPEGATVRINQKNVCVTPNCRITLAVGKHELQVAKAGYEPVSQWLTIGPINQSPEPVQLQLKPLKQALQVSTNFQSGKVSLDKNAVGLLQDGQLLMPDLPPGSHVLDIQGPDAEASVAFIAKPGQAPTMTKAPEAQQAQAIVVSGLDSRVHIACNCAEPVALDGRVAGNLGGSGLDLKDVTPGSHQLNIGVGSEQRTITISVGQAPVLDVFLASNRNVGTLVVETKQTGVDIFVNGRKYGRPTAQPLVRVPLDVNAYQVRVQKQGYRVSPPQQAEIRRNQDTKLVFSLEPEPATLMLRGAPADAQISVDGTRVGAAGPRGLFTGKIAPGEHVIELTKSGFSSHRLRRQFNPGETVILARRDVEMTELPPGKPAGAQPAETRAPAVANVESKPPEPVSPPPPAAVIPGSAQEWERISNSRDTAALDDFRKKYPNSPFAKQASQKIEQIDWEGVRNSGDAGALQAFLRKYPNGSFSEAAKGALANLDAQALTAERQMIREVLRRYAAAYDNKDVSAVAALYPALNKKEVNKIKDSFKVAQSVHMTLRPVGDLQVRGQKATVTCSRSLQYTFKDGAASPQADTVTVELSKKGGLWVIDSVH